MAKRKGSDQRKAADPGAAQPQHLHAHPEIAGWGADLDPKNRPGVPLARTPAPVGEAHWDEPERQAPQPHLVRMELGQLTPVFGTAQPPRGLPGAIRRVAYRVPEHRARRWLLLLAADRVEAYGGRLATGALVAGAVLALWRYRSSGRRGRTGPARFGPRRMARLAPTL
ncbi:MAG TPA: hypothetical protein VF406_16770 [Thermodesulfobacteriota bacterium]